MPRAYVGVGSNLGDSAGIVREAFDRLRTLGSNFVNSDLYRTEPWGKVDQPAFINAVVAFDTALEPHALLERLRAIEDAFGRQRAERWGPRTLDLDLLLYGNTAFADADIAVPHPRMRERAFVLEPLLEIAPDERAPTGESVRSLRDALPASERAAARRLVGTASLVPPPRVDYDAPGGAGALYDTLRPFSHFDRAVLDAVIHATGSLEGKRVLDIGCGTGRFTEKLAETGAHIIGLDPSDTMLTAARARRSQPEGGIEYVVGDANRSLPPGPFDAITAFYCMQYLDAPACARRAHDQLQSGGAIAVASFPHRHFADTEYARFFPSLPAIDMARFPSTPALENALSAAGFADVETKDVVGDFEDDPATLIGRVEQKYLSSFFLLPEHEFREGVAMMRREWQGRRVVCRTARAVVISGRASTKTKR